MKPDDLPHKVIVIIISDGMDNASRTYTYEAASELIRERKQAGWEFLFLGASLEAGREAYKLKIEKADAYYHPHTKQGIGDLFNTAGNAASAIRRGEERKNDTHKSGKSSPTEVESVPYLKLPSEKPKKTYAE